MTIREDPGNAERLIAATFGRGVYAYTFKKVGAFEQTLSLRDGGGRVLRRPPPYRAGCGYAID